MHQLVRNFCYRERRGKPLDHAMAFVIDQPIGTWWGHNISVVFYPWGQLAVYNGGTARLYDTILDTYVVIHLGPHHSPHILFLPGSLAGGHYDVPTKRQMFYRNICRPQLLDDF